MKKIKFLLYSSIALVLTVVIVGFVAHLLPSPAEFFTMLLSAIPLGYLAVKLSGYNRWPVAGLLLLIYFGLASGLNVKHLLYAGFGDRATEVTVKKAAEHPKKAFYSFTDARLDFDRSGYFLLEHYGDHHYYAFPVLGDDWKPGDEVAIWTWARTRKPCSADCRKRLLPSALKYGLKVRTNAVKVNVRRAAEEAAEHHEITLPDKIIILDWGSGMVLTPWWKRLRNQFLLFLGILAALILVEWAIGRNRNGKV